MKRHPTIEQTIARIRAMRLRMERRLPATHHGDRRAEDRYREEYRDQRAVVLNAHSTVAKRLGRIPAALSPGQAGTIRIRIVRSLPAPLMDGFDVGGLRADCVYDVAARTGRYLIIAGYARLVTDHPHRRAG